MKHVPNPADIRPSGIAALGIRSAKTGKSKSSSAVNFEFEKKQERWTGRGLIRADLKKSHADYYRVELEI